MKRSIAVALILVLASFFGCTWMYGSGRYTRGVSKTACEVWIYSLPQGSRTYLNGHYVGRTPYKYTGINNGDSSAHFIVRDLSEIMVRKRGYDDEVQIVTVDNCYRDLNIKTEGVRDQVKRYRGEITMYLDEKEVPIDEKFGNLMIEVVPPDPDAEIYINDNLIGNGKTSLLKLAEGSYVLKVRKPGYRPYARVIGIIPENDQNIKAFLQKEEGWDEEVETVFEIEDIELSPAGEETELEEDTVPGVIGGSE